MRNKLFLIFICVILVVSCTYREPIEKYKGGVVYDKYETEKDWLNFDVKKEERFYRVRVYRFDWDRYEIGDTIR